jgi:uncharacterized phage protein (TIGR01671 family)
MSRKIEFRVWDKHERRWLGDSEFSFVCIGLGGNVSKFCFSFETFDSLDAVDLMQYTGLKDKNGVEIYEGDILKSPNGGMGVVSFHKSWGAFYYKTVFIKNEEGASICAIGSNPFWNDADKYEIIGNIHENPELWGGERG